MNNTHIPTQTVDPQAVLLDNSATAATQSNTGISYNIYIIAIIALLTILFLLKKRNSKSTKKEIAIVGERGAGKTQLFIGLNEGKNLQTVPSIANNASTIQIGRKRYSLYDFIGDNVSKEEVVSEIARFHTLIHVVDGTDSKKLGDAALFIYRVLINKQFQKDPCQYVLLLNKTDLTNFHGQEKLIKRIEDQIQTIKVTRRNQSQENEEVEDDYLRNQKTRFDIKRQGIEIVVGSAQSKPHQIIARLQELCG